MAMTMWMPNTTEITVMMASGRAPLPASDCCRNSPPSQMTAMSRPRLNQWRAGKASGLLVILPLSLPKAMTEPEKVTAPMRIPR